MSKKENRQGFNLKGKKSYYPSKRSRQAVAQGNPSSKLTDKEEAFCKEYLVDLNGTRAAIRAGYSSNSAAPIASEYLLKPNVKKRLQELIALRNKRLEVSEDRIIKELARIAFTNMAEYAAWSGDQVTLENSEDLDENDTAAVSEVGQTVTKEGGSFKFKLHDKVKAMELLMRHRGMLSDKLDMTTKGNEIKQNVYNIINPEQKKIIEDLHRKSDAI
jgi:phage terminase small subunit